MPTYCPSHSQDEAREQQQQPSGVAQPAKGPAWETRPGAGGEAQPYAAGAPGEGHPCPDPSVAARVQSHWAEAPVAPNPSGPFSPAVNALLQAAFQQDLSGISVSRGDDAENRAINARAHTVGQHISLGAGIREEIHDGPSMEAIAHEVSHALAKGGSGKTTLNQPGDPGEHTAHEVGRTMRRFVEGAGQQSLPQLRPAYGGEAIIHRLEGGEHAHSVEDATAILRKSGRPHGGAVDPQVETLMTQPIRLPNNEIVTPGEFSSLMGDFYARFRKNPQTGKEEFDPEASFKQMWDKKNGPEMSELLQHIRREKETGKPESNLEYQKITEKYRNSVDPKTGKTEKGDLTYLDLAEKNEYHFSAATMKGSANNMGAYTYFHEQALAEARKGDKADPDKMRAFEAASMHFLADRHCAGHDFDKQQVMTAWQQGEAERQAEQSHQSPLQKLLPALTLSAGDGAKGLLKKVMEPYFPNLAAKAVHDDYNKKPPMEVHNARGDHWLAYGDQHWADKDNAKSRQQTAESEYVSFNELNNAMHGKETASVVNDHHYAAYDTVPQFDPKLQNRAEADARHLTKDDLLNNLITPENIHILAHQLGVDISSFGREKLTSIENFGKRVWGGTKQTAERVWDGTKQTAERVWDGTKSTGRGILNGIKSIGHKVWDGTKFVGHKLGQGLEYGEHKLQEGAERVEHTVEEGIHRTGQFLHDTGHRALEGGRQLEHRAVEGLQKVGHRVWEGAGEVGHDVLDGVRDFGHHLLHPFGHLPASRTVAAPRGAPQSAADDGIRSLGRPKHEPEPAY